MNKWQTTSFGHVYQLNFLAIILMSYSTILIQKYSNFLKIPDKLTEKKM